MLMVVANGMNEDEKIGKCVFIGDNKSCLDFMSKHKAREFIMEEFNVSWFRVCEI